jgi:hypothetical protein
MGDFSNDSFNLEKKSQGNRYSFDQRLRRPLVPRVVPLRRAAARGKANQADLN